MKKTIHRIGLFLCAIWVGVGITLWYRGIFVDVNNKSLGTKNISSQYNYSATAYFAGGCFWCMEAIFEAQEWVEWAYSGYTGWEESTATYEQTSKGNTAHREAVRVVYDPEVISYRKLLELYWTQTDPTDGEGQFNDRGYVYSPAIYYSTQEEKAIAELSKKHLQDSWRFNDDIVTAIEPARPFYDAEDYHQDYYKNNPIRYKLYTAWSGRKDFIEQNWQDRIDELEWKKYVNGTLVEDNISRQKTSQYSQEQLREMLTPIQYKVTQEMWTEPAFNNAYWDNKKAGIYVDIIDGTPLYSSLDKFDSGTGWPSFTRWIDESNLVLDVDTRFFMTRTEVSSATSWAHLWHIFEDAPQELGGIRHCINSASLRFIPVESLESEWYGEYLEMFQ